MFIVGVGFHILSGGKFWQDIWIKREAELNLKRKCFYGKINKQT